MIFKEKQNKTHLGCLEGLSFYQNISRPVTFPPSPPPHPDHNQILASGIPLPPKPKMPTRQTKTCDLFSSFVLLLQPAPLPQWQLWSPGLLLPFPRLASLPTSTLLPSTLKALTSSFSANHHVPALGHSINCLLQVTSLLDGSALLILTLVNALIPFSWGLSPEFITLLKRSILQRRPCVPLQGKRGCLPEVSFLSYLSLCK